MALPIPTPDDFRLLAFLGVRTVTIHGSGAEAIFQSFQEHVYWKDIVESPGDVDGLRVFGVLIKVRKGEARP